MDSFRYLVVTRVLACVIALPLLTTLMNFTGLLGGYTAEAAITGIGFETYFRAAMAQLMQYPRNSPLVVEGYATDDEDAYLASLDRAQRVRDYVLSRFRRQTASTGVMPLSGDAAGSPRGDGAWPGVALTMYVPNTTFREGTRRREGLSALDRPTAH